MRVRLASQRWRLLRVVTAAALLATGTQARAEPQTNSAKAEALFREATKLLGAGEISAACARFAESKRLEPGIGVTLYLGDCYERLGRTASAWGEFTAAEDMARRAHDPRARVAHDRAARLEPRLSKIVVTVDAGESDEALEVTQDGVIVGTAQWGVALPVDPGRHRVSATAPHRKAWTREIEVTSGPSTVTLEVPGLEPIPETPAQPPHASGAEPSPLLPEAKVVETGSRGDTQRIIALVTLGAGVAGIGAGAIFGLDAKSRLDSSNAGGCNARDQCDASGLAQRSDGLRDATISTIAFVAGGAALVGGVLLYVTAPRSPARGRVEVSGAAAKGGGEVTLTARF